MEVLIQGAVSSLGILEEDGQYSPEPDCYETLRDLIRYLRNDNEVWIARRTIGERNVVENDLIPLMKCQHNDDKMFDIILRLMVNIVQPSIISMMGKMPEDQRQLKYVYELEDNLRKSKLAFADPQLFAILKQRLEKYFLMTDWDDRTEEDRLVMERIIVLFRYVLCISSSRHDEKRTALDSNSHDRVILEFLISGLHQTLIHIASQGQEKDFHLSILEIFALIVKEHNPEDIVSATTGRSEEERRKAETELKQAFENEQTRIAELKRKMMSTRHSRFAGSYWVEGLSTMNKENKFFTNKPVMDPTKISFLDERKKKKRQPSSRRVFDVKQETHLSSLDLRMKLKEFVECVLAKSFNRLMKSTRELAFGQRRTLAQRNADMHFFLMMSFFLKYCRLSSSSTSTVNSCIGVETFHHVQMQIDQYLENAALQKKEGKIFGMKAQYAVSAYKELVLFHQHMLDSGNPEEKEDARSACKHILNVEEYREMGISILRKFQPAAMSRTFLRELVLATHYYFRLLERSVKKGELQSVQVRQKKRTTRKPKRTADMDAKPAKKTCDSFAFERLDLIWARISTELSNVVLGYEEAAEDQLPMSNMLDVTDEEHQRFAMLRIQRALRERRVADAVGLYRSARDIWLLEEVFGKSDMPPEEEFVELREIFYADLSEISDALLLAEMNSDARFRNNDLMEEYGGSEDEEEPSYETKEISFDFNGYVGRFAASDVIKWYVFLLADFDKNTAELNKAVVKMLHRIAFDMKMQCRLYQLSLFRIFQRVGQRMNAIPPAEKKNCSLYELHTFGFHLLKKFFKRITEVGEKMAPEALFWKGAKESYELEFGYGSYQQSKDEAKMTWTEDLEDQLKGLYNEWRDMDERPSGMDVLDFIEANLDRPRTRHQISKKMKEFGLDNLGAVLKHSSTDRQFPLIAMKELVERFHNMNDNNSFDLVDWLRTTLEERGAGTFTRQKIVKQLNYAGISYERMKTKKAPKLPKWPEELTAELSNLKMQWEDDEDKGEVSLTDYVVRRLSQSKLRRQVELHLNALGANVPVSEIIRVPRNTDSKRTKRGKKYSDAELGDDSENGLNEKSDDEKIMSDSSDEDSDSPLANSDDEEGDMGVRRPRSKSSTSVKEYSQESNAKASTKNLSLPISDDEDDMVDSPQETRPQCSSPERESNINSPEIKKKRIVVDSDQEEEEVSMDSNSKVHTKSPSSPPKLPQAIGSFTNTKKRKRLVSSDESGDDEDVAIVSEKGVSADGAQSIRKARRVVLDSDDES